jgi:predicted dehydrogenase
MTQSGRDAAAAVAGEPTAVALVGAGAWGQNLLRNFATLPGARLAWVCDASERARALASASCGARVTADLDHVLGDAAVRGVVVATNAGSHHAIASAALRAGKDVLVEKPLALSGDDAAELCDLAERGGRVLMVGHLLLYHPAVEALKGLLDAGELGDALYLYSQRLNLGIVRPDENAWWSLAPHDVALANHLLGAEPESISASGTTLGARPDAHDVVFATLLYPRGRLAHVHVSWLDPQKTRRLTVVGTRQMAVFDDASADEKLVVFDKGVEPPSAVTYADGVRVRTGEIRIPAVRMEEPLRRECAAFVRAIVTRKAPLTDGASGLAVVRALEAGARSLAARGRPEPVRPTHLPAGAAR